MTNISTNLNQLNLCLQLLRLIFKTMPTIIIWLDKSHILLGRPPRDAIIDGGISDVINILENLKLVREIKLLPAKIPYA